MLRVPARRAAPIRLLALAMAVAGAATSFAATSNAASDQLDPTFGANGLTVIAGADRYEAQGPPLVGAGGRITVAGLLKNSSDRVFLSALTADGANDNGFGSAGIAHTSTKATERKAVIARRDDGRIVIAGRSDSGRLQLESVNADGTRDTAFGSNGTLSVAIPNNNSVPTAMTVSGGSTWVALTSPSASQRKGFVVAKLTQTGLDPSFGAGGVATVSFGNTAGQAFDIALAGGGKLVVAGSVGAVGASASDTRLARLNPNGSIDTTFSADGLHNYDASQAAGADHGVAVLPFADAIYAVSSADGKTAISRLTVAGALDAAYAGDGIAQGLAPAGAGFAPADAIRDAAGRIVVAGESLAGTTTKWALLRANPKGTTPLDTTFGAGGYIAIDECQNTAGNGPSGLAEPAADTLLVAGGCGAADSVAVARLKLPKGKIVPTAASLEVDPIGEAAGHERINLNKLDPSAVAGDGVTLQAAATRRIATRRIATRRIATRRISLATLATRRIALSGMLLSELPLTGTTWNELLGTDVPLQTLTLEDAYNINPGAVEGLTLADVDPNATVIREASLAALVLGLRPLSALPEPAGGWCGHLSDQPYNCDSAGFALDSAILFDLEVSGDDLSEYYSQPISLTDTDLGSGSLIAPLATFPLAELDLGVDPFAQTKASEVSSILDCGSSCDGTLADLTPAEIGDATVGELVGVLPVPSLADLSVGQVLVGLIPPQDIPYELMDLPRLLDEAEFRAVGLHGFRVPFSVDCGTEGGLRAVADLAGDARPVPGSATLAVGGAAPAPIDDASRARLGDPYAFDLARACAGEAGPTDAMLRFDVEGGSVLGYGDSAVTIESEFAAVDTNEVRTHVDDRRDPGNTIDDALPLTEEELRTGHLTHDRDVDTFAFTGVEGETTITLSHLPADYDLAILGPEVGPESTATRRIATRRIDLTANVVPDASGEPNDPTVVAPDSVEDLATRRIATRRIATRRISINRGTADESATVQIRPEDAGETFYAQVLGYNGANDPNPYVVRMIDDPAAEDRECPVRDLSSGVTYPFPGDDQVGEGTEALYLVHPGRMAARDGESATAEMLTRLEALAAQTNGVIVPVGNDPQVDADAAFAAWDQQPCDAAAANAAAGAVDEVVDHVRDLGEGTPNLRSIVLVGPDDVLPQHRVPDEVEIAPESEYAVDAAFDVDGDQALEDNASSGALADDYVLSDDPHGDFDPTGSLFVPDVALGRLIETPAQIEQQVDAFLESDGVIDPKRAFVTGYDFISDGAEAQRAPLAGRVGEPATQALINESWSAADANAGLSASEPGFLGVNAHFDHFRLLPAAAFNDYEPDLLSARETDPAPGSAIFTVGCHAGLNLAIAGTGDSTDPRLTDWAEKITATGGGLFAGNTGYGYGDTETVAYSEALMARYAGHLTSGEVTTGQALMMAKNELDEEIASDHYLYKALVEATFYGLPMYRVGPDGGVGAPVIDDVANVSGTAEGGPQAASVGTRSATEVDFDLAGDLHEVTTDRGSYWQVGSQEPLVVQHRPIVPQASAPVPEPEDPDAVGRSYFVEGMTTVDVKREGGVDPVIARPTIDLAANEPEPEASSPYFPARLATIDREVTPDGLVEKVKLAAGSFRDGTQRLVTSVDGLVMSSTDPSTEPATIRRVDGNVSPAGNLSIRVEAEGGAITGGNVLFITDADAASSGPVEWHSFDLAVVDRANGVLATGGPLPSGTRVAEAYVQVQSENGTTALSANKVEGYAFQSQPETGEGDPRVLLSPDLPSSGFYTGGTTPQVALDEGDHDDATFEYSVDGDPFERYDGPFTPSGIGEGEHLVYFRGSDGSSTFARWAVDNGPPEITAEADQVAENAWYGEPVTISYRCADAVSGVASCSGPQTFDADVRGASATGTAVDRAGNSASTTVSPINVDRSAPAITAQRRGSANSAGWDNAPVTVDYACSDALSGLASCAGRALTGAPHDASATEVIDTEGTGVTASRSAADLASNSASAGVSPSLNIDMTTPDVAVKTPNNAILVAPLHRVEGWASDALAGVDRVVVTYSRPGETQQRTAELSGCNATTGRCNWRAALPKGLGAWTATATAYDKAGNPRDAQSIEIFISLA